jgi:hypothetical protein
MLPPIYYIVGLKIKESVSVWALKSEQMRLHLAIVGGNKAAHNGHPTACAIIEVA